MPSAFAVNQFRSSATASNEGVLDNEMLPPPPVIEQVILPEVNVPVLENNGALHKALNEFLEQEYCQQITQSPGGTYTGNLASVVDREASIRANNPTLSTTVPDPFVPIMRCTKVGCKVRGPEVYECGRKNCKKHVHLLCYQGICIIYNLEQLHDQEVACTKICHDK